MITRVIFLVLLTAVGFQSQASNGLVPAIAATSPTSGHCTPVREASATFYIYKNSWTQNQGVWTQKTENVFKINGFVPVYSGELSGCPITNVATGEVELNGETLKVSVYGDIFFHMVNNTPNQKYFWAQYYINQDKGQWANASVFSSDLTLKAIGLNFENPRINDSTGAAHGDSLTIAVNFEDNNAN